MKHKTITQKWGISFLLWITCLVLFSTQAQVWGLPCGSLLGGSYGYLTTATTQGEGVYIPLDYLNGASDSRYFVMYEADEPFTVIKGKSFELNLIAKNGGAESTTAVVPDLRTTCALIYSDWNCDGLFEQVAQVGTVAAANTPQGNMDVLQIKQTIAVPADAKSGKTRIRVRYTKAKNGALEIGAMHDVTNGLLFDIAVKVIDPNEPTDCKLIVKSNSPSSGTAEIVTPSKANGRFDKDTKVHLQATVVDPEQEFIAWTVAGVEVSRDLSYEFTVSESKMVVANFSSPLPNLTLSTPQASTEQEPIWFQIMNAQTDNRKDMCISNDGAVFKCLKPADGSSQFLWRMETTEGSKVKFISKKDGHTISFSGTSLQLSSSENGAEFVISPSGNANGSYSVKYNNDATKLLNCDGTSNNLVLFNGGVGTGSGWYFYKATFSAPSSVEESSADRIHVSVSDGKLSIQDCPSGANLRIHNVSGVCVQNERIVDCNSSFSFQHPKGCYLIDVQLPTGSRRSYKIIQ